MSIKKKELIYGKGLIKNSQNNFIEKDLKLYIFNNSNNINKKKPTLIKIHGGGFIDGNEMEFYNLTTHFCNKGFQVIAITYRLGPEKGLVPKEWSLESERKVNDIENKIKTNKILSRESADGLPLTRYLTKDVLNGAYTCIRDVKAAMRYLTKNKDILNIDENKICMFGESAGALATFAYSFTQHNDISKYFFKDTDEYVIKDTTLQYCNPDIKPMKIDIYVIYSGSTLVVDQLKDVFVNNLYKKKKYYPKHLYIVHDKNDIAVEYLHIRNFYLKNKKNKNYIFVRTEDNAGHVPSEQIYIDGVYSYVKDKLKNNKSVSNNPVNEDTTSNNPVNKDTTSNNPVNENNNSNINYIIFITLFIIILLIIFLLYRYM